MVYKIPTVPLMLKCYTIKLLGYLHSAVLMFMHYIILKVNYKYFDMTYMFCL